MNTSMTGLRWFSKTVHLCALDESIASALEGLNWHWGGHDYEGVYMGVPAFGKYQLWCPTKGQTPRSPMFSCNRFQAFSGQTNIMIPISKCFEWRVLAKQKYFTRIVL